MEAGVHTHLNWVFSTPGQYRIGVQAPGLLAATAAKLAELRQPLVPKDLVTLD